MKDILKLFVLNFLIIFSQNAFADSPAIHGMLLFGNENAYASHLPMFHPPHDYQLIMKLALADQAPHTTLSKYQQAQAKGEFFFTLVPAKMDLVPIMKGERNSFTATIYEGHFERGGKVLGLVKVTVSKIIYSQKLKGYGHSGEHENYLVFGEKNEYFAYHQINGRPSFDAILKVKQPYEIFYPPCGRAACPDPQVITIPDEKLPHVKVVMTSTQNAPEELKVGMTMGEEGGPLLDILQVLYIEKSDLE